MSENIPILYKGGIGYSPFRDHANYLAHDEKLRSFSKLRLVTYEIRLVQLGMRMQNSEKFKGVVVDTSPIKAQNISPYYFLGLKYDRITAHEISAGHRSLFGTISCVSGQGLVRQDSFSAGHND